MIRKPLPTLLIAAWLAGQTPVIQQTAQTESTAQGTTIFRQGSWPRLNEEQEARLEQRIEDRDRSANGIQVGVPKVYDDSLLQQMLNAAESRLSSLQAIDQASILNRLGSITGARQQISSLGISVQGLPLPQVATTANGATNNVVATQKADTSQNSTVTTTNAPVTNVVTTAPQVSPPSVSAPAPSTTMPSSFSVAASDILDEQMQLTSEIANLRLLLEGSLNDWYVSSTGGKGVKPRITIGFPIAISPACRYKNAVAIVEAVVQTFPNADLSSGRDLPAITALLPREKTYNVAAITDRSFSLGLGLVTQIAGVSGSFFTGRKTYYLVKDQDTVARAFDADPGQTGFLWEFRPVLGRAYVQSGLKQTFVQLAFPSAQDAGPIGQVRIRTYWRKVDPKNGVLKEVVDGSVRESPLLTLNNFDLKQDLGDLRVESLEDLGGGQVLVNVGGRFLGGTYVRVGSNILNTGSAGFTSEYRRIRFVAAAADLATRRTVLVSRDGTEIPLQLNTAPPVVSSATFTPLDETNSLLKIAFASDPRPFGPPILIIGGKVYGYSDAPVSRDGRELTVALPTALLLSNRDAFVTALLADDRTVQRISLVDAGAEGERLVYLAQDTTNATFVLFGRNLRGIQKIFPSSASVENLADGVDPGALQKLTIALSDLKTQKLLVLRRPTESRPIFLSIPALPSASGQGAAADPKFQERVTVGADAATLTGNGLDQIDSASFGSNALTISDKSAKSLTITGLARAGATAVAKTQQITFISKTGKITADLEVVSEKIEIVAK